MNKTKSLILFFSALTISCSLVIGGCAPKSKQVKKSEVQKLSDAEIRTAEEKRVQKEREDRETEKLRIVKEEERLKAEQRRLEEEKLEEERMRQQAEAEPQAFRTAGSEASNLRDISFPYNKFGLGAKAMEILQKNAEWLQENSRIKIQIEGHCDERGTSEYNLALGEKRALSAKKYLMSLGVEAERIYTISYGEELPLDSGHNESSWGKNRRAHFLITSK